MKGFEIMKNFKSRIVCILLAAAMLVSAIAGVAGSVFPTASAATFFTPSKGSFYEAKGTTIEQGTAVWELLAAQTQADVADKMYDIIFRAQYCVTDFGGDLWCNPNTAGQIKSVTDSVLGTVNWGWGGSGWLACCFLVMQVQSAFLISHMAWGISSITRSMGA